MRLTAISVAVLAFSGTAQAAPAVCVFVNSNSAPKDVIHFAKGISSRIFATAGVVVEWHSGALRPQDKVSANPIIIVDVEANAPRDSSPAALAYARPYEGVHIAIFYDRVQSISRDNPVLRPMIVAHVITHEITHILQGDVHHSTTGIMKARWDANDYLEMTRAPLSFASEDIDLLRNGLQLRALLAQQR